MTFHKQNNVRFMCIKPHKFTTASYNKYLNTPANTYTMIMT